MTKSTNRNSPQIRSVLLCSDILATRKSEQTSNLKWFADLLERPIGAAARDATVRRDLGPDFNRSEVLSEAVGKEMLGERHCWFDADKIGPDRLSFLRDAIGTDTLVVGYELSHMTRAALQRLNVPWIDIWLHPVRFADDILFAMRASDQRIQSRLEQFAVPAETISAQADLLRIQNYRGFSKFEWSLVDGSALFVGQTSRDKSVLEQRGFLSLLDFSEEFAELASRYPQVYFSRHPNEPRLDPDIRSLLQSFGNVSEIDAPTYQLIADRRIAAVASISSSVLEEARFFGKDIINYYRPPVPLQGEGRYTTILHSLCFSHFWAAILQDVTDVQACPDAGFIDPKNKLRHALSFYWGYRDIDKYEHLMSPPSTKTEPDPPKPTIETADLVSFDVFDTLITRRFSSPYDIFAAIAKDAAQVIGDDAQKFVERRREVEKIATAHAAKSGREDPNLAEIYQSLLHCSANDPRVDQLCALEIDAEKKAARVRPAGAALFAAAQRAGRCIILVSDMYLPRTVIEEILVACGYEGWNEFYLSCDRGRTKRSGSLFELVLYDTGVAADRILHIGDNPRGDIAIPERLGISCLHLPRAVDVMRETAPFLRNAAAWIGDAGAHNGSAILSQISRRHFDDPANTPQSGDFGRNAETFGYVTLGPFLAGFADWLHEEASARRITNLGFLTREGPILRAAYEALFPDSPIATETVIASRRIAKGISRATEEQVAQATLHASEGQYRDISDFLNVQFGLQTSDIDASVLEGAGFPSLDATVGPQTPAESLRSVVLMHQEKILEKSKEARGSLCAYLNDIGLVDGRIGLVDVGYAGRIQAAYSGVTGTEFSGFYSALFRTAKDVLGELPAEAYLASGVSANDRRYGICRHRQIYETLLCAPGPTYVGIARTADGWQGVTASGCETPIRDEFVKEAHRGALDFVRDFSADRDSSERVSPTAATALIDAMLDEPTADLAKWLGGLEFEDKLDFHGTRKLIETGDNPVESVWPEGAKVLSQKRGRRRRSRSHWQARGPYGLLGWRHALSPIVAPIIARIGDAQDADHFRDDPIGFFRRLSDPRYRRIGRILYPWD